MNILLVIPYLTPIYGGPTVIFKKIIDVLSNFNYNITIITTTANGDHELDIQTNIIQIKNGLSYIYFRRRGPKFLMFSPSLFYWLFNNLKKYDLVHIHCVFNLFSFLTCFFSKLFNLPYILSPHGALDPYCFSYKWWKKIPYYYFIERFNLFNSKIIHVTSSMEASAISGLGYASKIYSLPLCIDFPISHLSNRTFSESLNLIFVSRLDPIKGLPVLFEAISLINQKSKIIINLKIIGDGDPKYVLILKNLTRIIGISQQVSFYGFLEKSQIFQIFAHSDVFVLPSFHENFSLVTAEALAAGLPVIITDQVGISGDVINSNAGDIIPVNMPVALADAILKYSDPTVRQKASENAKRLAEKNYSPSLFGDKLINMYKFAIKK